MLKSIIQNPTLAQQEVAVAAAIFKMADDCFPLSSRNRAMKRVVNHFNNLVKTAYSEEKTNYCPVCGNQEISSEANFCKICGNRLR